MNRKIPFNWRPTSWFLSGEAREIAKIEYEMDGYDKEIALAELKYPHDERFLQKIILDIQLKHEKLSMYEYEVACAELNDQSAKELAKQVLDIKIKHEKISEYQYEMGLAELINDEDKRELKKLSIQLQYGILTEEAYAKAANTIKNEPWVSISDITFDPDNPAIGSWKMDWNDQFIEFLHDHGYSEPTEEGTVDRWMNDVCKHVALEAFDGIGDINERLEGISPEDKESRRVDDSRYYKD
jgi:hypothetical protein